MSNRTNLKRSHRGKRLQALTEPQMPKLHTLKPAIATQPTRLKTIHPGSWRTEGMTSHARGYNYAWRKARGQHLYDNPLCVQCEAEGRVTIATVVDHVDPHRGNQQIFWDRSRWQSLCAHHHASTKQRGEAYR